MIVIPFAAAIGFIGYQFFLSDAMRVSEILIEGSNLDTRYRPLLVTKIGDPFWKLSLIKEVENLKQQRWVESVEVRRQLPTTIVISIQERKPVAIVGDKKGNFSLIDKRSNYIDHVEMAEAPDLPLLLGDSLVKGRALREQGLDLIQQLPAEGALSKQDLSHVEYDPEKGFVLTLQKTGIQIKLGKDNIPLRIDRARRVVQYLGQHNITGKVVDADFSKKVLVQTREK